MQVAGVGKHTTCREVVGFEGSVPPGATREVRGVGVGWGGMSERQVGIQYHSSSSLPEVPAYLEIISGLSSVSCLEILVLKALPLLTQ